MQEFNYLDYYTKYSCIGSINVDLIDRVCFMDVFKNMRNNFKYTENYIVYIYKGTSYGSVHKKSNMCLITREQLVNHIRQAKGIVPFTFRITSIYEENIEIYKVHLHLKNVRGIYHKYLLAWLRYTYEFPFNVMLLDALRLKKNPIFRFTSIVTLFNIVYSAYPTNVRTIHSIVARKDVQIKTIKQIKEGLKRTDLLNALFNTSSKGCKLKCIPTNCGPFTPNDAQFWDDDNFIKYREQIYIHNYKDLR